MNGHAPFKGEILTTSNQKAFSCIMIPVANFVQVSLLQGTGQARDEAHGSLALHSIKFKINEDSVTFVVNLSAFFFISLKNFFSICTCPSVCR